MQAVTSAIAQPSPNKTSKVPDASSVGSASTGGNGEASGRPLPQPEAKSIAPAIIEPTRALGDRPRSGMTSTVPLTDLSIRARVVGRALRGVCERGLCLTAGARVDARDQPIRIARRPSTSRSATIARAPMVTLADLPIGRD